MSETPGQDIKTGSCLCSMVTYTLTGAPMYSTICHCSNCRKATGSLFTANSGYTKSQLSILTGADSLKTYPDKNTTSGNTMERQFCSNCGSLLFTVSPDHPRMKDAVVVYSGSIDGGEGTWEPQYEFFCGKRAKWLPGFERTAKFEGLT